MANTAHMRNCLSGASAEHWRKITFSRVTGEEIELPIPAEQALSPKILKEVSNWFKKDPQNTNAVVLFNESFMFSPDEVTTGSKALDSELIKANPTGLVITSMAFKVANNAKVTFKGSTIILSTGWVHINGQYAADIIPPVPMPSITIASNGFITFT